MSAGSQRAAMRESSPELRGRVALSLFLTMHRLRLAGIINKPHKFRAFQIKGRISSEAKVGAVAVAAVTETTKARSGGSGVDWDIFSAEPDDVILLPHLQG